VMTQNRSNAHRPRIGYWVAVAALTIALFGSLIEGDILNVFMYAAIILAALLHATGLIERSAVAKRLSTVLWVLAAVLVLINLYTIIAN
jgi:hypothetical protein